MVFQQFQFSRNNNLVKSFDCIFHLTIHTDSAKIRYRKKLTEVPGLFYLNLQISIEMLKLLKMKL